MDIQLLEGTARSVEPTAETTATASGGFVDAASVFVGTRPALIKIAYRILGSVDEAEDVVQEVWLRWQCTDRTVVLDAPAFLATTTTRFAINVARSARRRHEVFASSWLPEPMDSGAGPETRAERREAVEVAMLLLMERLTPTERAAYVLREGFAYPYRRISEVLHLGVANTRQLARRARQRITSERRVPVSSASHRRLVHAFLAAAQAGNLTDLEELLATESTTRDGSKAFRPTRPSEGKS